jgi:hypothetical protein
VYESRHQTVISRIKFYRRLGLHLLIASALLLISLAIGMVGYRVTEDMDWLDAFLNASMLLGGMGPIGELKTSAGKFFAGCYALYSGLLFVICSALIMTPVIHRVLHIFHVQDKA